MPNWTENKVTINASIDEVTPYFIQVTNEERWSWWEFNMHLLFPDRFWEDDPLWQKNRDYDWCVENTGSKRLPRIAMDDYGSEVKLRYDSARVPNNLTLLKLSKLTGWWIQNVYEEEGQRFEGVFVCERGEVVSDRSQDFHPYCAGCGRKYSEEKVNQDEETGEWVCKNCRC